MLKDKLTLLGYPTLKKKHRKEVYIIIYSGVSEKITAKM